MSGFRRSRSNWLSLSVVILMTTPHFCFSADLSAKLRPWRDYRTIMWIGDSASQHPEKLPLFLQRLREMGINTSMIYGDSDPQSLVDTHFPYYVENMVNRGLCLKFNSKVADWDKFVTDWARNGRPESALIRDYCLDDAEWLNSARKTVGSTVRSNKDRQPLAYNIRDELSTTISANPFDYDFSPVALEQFRIWLKTQYTDLATLNTEWETQFGSWNDVKPFTTDQIKNRMASGEPNPRGQPNWQQVQQLRFDSATARNNPTRWNFSPWADFRTYMDMSLARALAEFRQTAHEIDPSTPVGIEGTQMPAAFGGYDLWRLSQVLDWVEPYDIGGARAIFGSFMPGKPILTTVFEAETRAAQRRLWHLLLEGDRGCLVWWSEDCIDWKHPDWPLTSKAKALAPVLREMTSPLARLFLRADRESDPVLIHYSQPSIQVDWLLESIVDGSTWLRRFSSFEAEHNQMARTRVAWLKGLQDLGYSPRFISSAELEQGKLQTMTNAVLILADSLALSEKEITQVESLLKPAPNASAQQTLFVEGQAGSFDQHGKLRPVPGIGASLLGASTNMGCLAVKPNGRITRTAEASRGYLSDRLKKATASTWLDWVGGALRQVPLEIAVPPSACVRIYRFPTKLGRLVAFERNIDYQMSEDLKQAGGNGALEVPVQVEAVLHPTHAYDLRTEKYLGRTDRLRFTLDPWQPSLFALLREKLHGNSVLAELANDLGPGTERGTSRTAAR
jgi:hypothetical protein